MDHPCLPRPRPPPSAGQRLVRSHQGRPPPFPSCSPGIPEFHRGGSTGRQGGQQQPQALQVVVETGSGSAAARFPRTRTSRRFPERAVRRISENSLSGLRRRPARRAACPPHPGSGPRRTSSVKPALAFALRVGQRGRRTGTAARRRGPRRRLPGERLRVLAWKVFGNSSSLAARICIVGETT